MLAAPAVLALGRLFPPEGLGLALRLGGAAACVLILPGALLVRALGGIRGVAVAASASLALSLAVVALGLGLVFASGSSLSLAVVVLAVFLLAGLGADLARSRASVSAAEPLGHRLRRPGAVALAGVAGAAVVYAGVVWWAGGPPGGDALSHLARVRKLVELPALRGLDSVDEFADGGLHPGYAFPLWHGALALVARLAHVDPTLVVEYLGALLVPLALVVAYGAGRAVLGSWAGGLAVALLQAAQLGFSRGAVGSFALLANPASISRAVLFPALLALFFALLDRGGLPVASSIAAAAFALTAVHPTYGLFALVVVAALLVARLAIGPDRRAGLGPAALGLALVAVPVGAFVAWLRPIVEHTVSVAPGAGERARSFAHYATQLGGTENAFHLAPETITRGGPVVVAGLLAVPLAAFAARRRWSALVLGATAAILLLLLVTPLFGFLSDSVSLSQSRRLASFLPIPFALAGAAFLAARLRWVGVALALAAGIAAELLFTADLSYRVVLPGPAWPVWFALAGSLAGLVAAAVLVRAQRAGGTGPPVWAAAAAIAFVLPVAVGGLAALEKEPAPKFALTPGLVAELRALPPGAVVFSTLTPSYYAAAAAPVSIAAAPPQHVADTTENHPYERRRDVLRFFSDPRVTASDRFAILAKYRAGWLLVDRHARYPAELVSQLQLVYRDDRFALYRLLG